jgi:hypothetical protein
MRDAYVTHHRDHESFLFHLDETQRSNLLA